MGDNSMQSEKDPRSIEQQLAGSDSSEKQQLAGSEASETKPEPTIKLTRTRFVLVLVGLVLAIFLVRIENPAARARTWH